MLAWRRYRAHIFGGSLLAMGVALLVVFCVPHGKVGSGNGVFRSSIPSQISLREVAHISIVSDKQGGASMQRLAWSPDGRWLRDPDPIRVWDAATGSMRGGWGNSDSRISGVSA